MQIKMQEPMLPLYSGKKKKFSWVGFGSGSGTNLRECAKIIKPAMIFSDRPSAKLLELEELEDVPKEVTNGYEFCGSWKKAQGDSKTEEEYKERSEQYTENIVNMLHEFEEKQGRPIDLIVLGGYMRLIGSALLERYRDKIINVHPADLSILQKKEKKMQRLLIGGDAVYDAIKIGHERTRSTAIMVDEGIDHGEILTTGASVENNYHHLKEQGANLRKYADEHQENQKVVSDWPTLTTALELIAEGRIKLGVAKVLHGEWRRVYVDDKEMGYGGYQVGGEKND